MEDVGKSLDCGKWGIKIVGLIISKKRLLCWGYNKVIKKGSMMEYDKRRVSETW